jgi:hypothetical protein
VGKRFIALDLYRNEIGFNDTLLRVRVTGTFVTGINGRSTEGRVFLKLLQTSQHVFGNWKIQEM